MNASAARLPVVRLLLALATATLLVTSVLLLDGPVAGSTPVVTKALAPADCGPGSRPEPGIVGRVPAEDFESGRAARGYTCNARVVGRTGSSGGFKVHRYRDSAGRVCAYYDLSRAFPTGAFESGVEGLGTAVLDMSNPRRPRRTTTLRTPAMLSPHESLELHRGRGLLVAVMGTLTTAPGVLDVYDVSKDCRKPELLSSTPAGFLGHESGFSADGRTFWASGLIAKTITAVDLTDPRLPRSLTTIRGVLSHGVRTSPDGRTLYVADMGDPDNDHLVRGGLRIFDVSEVQARAPLPKVRELSRLHYPDVAVPQVPQPFRVDGRDYVLMVDEFSALRYDVATYRPDNAAAIARIVDVENPRRPRQVSALRLQVHLTKNRAGAQRNDPGATNPVGGYAAHYCSVARFKNPRLAACSYIGSGLRVFDISDVRRPREVAYANMPDQGFFAVRLAKRVWPKGL